MHAACNTDAGLRVMRSKAADASISLHYGTCKCRFEVATMEPTRQHAATAYLVELLKHEHGNAHPKAAQVQQQLVSEALAVLGRHCVEEIPPQKVEQHTANRGKAQVCSTCRLS